MTQYMLSVHATDDDPTPSEQEMQQAYARVDDFNAKLREAGAWVFGGGLHGRDAATVVDGTGNKAVTTDGPFSESKEYLGGFWVISAPDLDAALKQAEEASAACGAPVEVRPFQDE